MKHEDLIELGFEYVYNNLYRTPSNSFSGEIIGNRHFLLYNNGKFYLNKEELKKATGLKTNKTK